jgi:predicted nucleic acid-binding protein
MAYLDTSVLASYYCPESLSNKVQRALAEVKTPVISSLVELELHSALAMKVRSRAMDRATAGKIAAVFQLHMADRRYRIVPIAVREYTLARSWLSTFNSSLRTLDALHLAAAFANGLTLISADRVLIRCAKEFGVEHRLIA